MSGTAKVKPPKSAAEHTRNTQRRIESLENPTSQRVGDWVLSTGENGELVASNVNGGSVILAAVPEGGEENPDLLTARSPVLKAQKSNLSAAVPSTYVAVVWDTIDIEYPSWAASSAAASEFVVPEDGVYLVVCHIAFPGATQATYAAAIQINGTLPVRIAQANDGSGSTGVLGHPTAVDIVRLAAGDVIRGMVLCSAALNYGIDGDDFSFLAAVKI